jgi:hypothetical protein
MAAAFSVNRSTELSSPTRTPHCILNLRKVLLTDTSSAFKPLCCLTSWLEVGHLILLVYVIDYCILFETVQHCSSLVFQAQLLSPIAELKRASSIQVQYYDQPCERLGFFFSEDHSRLLWIYKNRREMKGFWQPDIWFLLPLDLFGSDFEVMHYQCNQCIQNTLLLLLNSDRVKKAYNVTMHKRCCNPSSQRPSSQSNS